MHFTTWTHSVHADENLSSVRLVTHATLLFCVVTVIQSEPSIRVRSDFAQESMVYRWRLKLQDRRRCLRPAPETQTSHYTPLEINPEYK